MRIRVSDPLFLLSAQTGLSAFELAAKAASGNPDVEKPQEALKTGEPIPIIFCRRTTANKGGVLVQPKMTEGFFSNPLFENKTNDGGGVVYKVNQRLRVKYLLILGEGNIAQMQVRDLFYGNDRRGTFNQKYNGRAGSWNPGNEIDSHFTTVVTPDANGVYDVSAVPNLSSGQSLRAGSRVFYKDSQSTIQEFDYEEQSFPAFCGTSGTYSGLTTLSFEYTHKDGKAAKAGKTVSAFVRDGMQVTRLVDNVTGASDNYVDLVKYFFEANNRLASDLIDTAALTIAANFVDANGFYFNGAITESQNLLDWLQKTSVDFLLRVSNSGGKFGLLPRLPYNTDYTIKTTQITPEFTFTEEHVVQGGFEIEYISLEDREPVCFVIQWRQQPNADFGLVRTVEVRYTGEAANGPFIDIDMSGYCTSEDHAVKAGTYRLAQRKFVTHHLRLTVREQNYNATLVIGDLVRVRLRRETSEGDAEYHDKIYEINRIEKGFASTIKYDLTHFPIDAQGRSIVAREVDGVSGAGNIIDVGRSTFDGDENSSTDTTLIGTDFGGGGTIPPASDTSFDIPTNTSSDTSYPGGSNNPADSLEDLSPKIDTGGSLGSIGAGDTLSFTPGCAGAFTEWYKINDATGEVTNIGSGVGAVLNVSEALLEEGVTVYGVGRCPDPSSPDGYGAPVQSNLLSLDDEYSGICWCFYAEVYYKFDTNCPCPSPTYPNCTTTPFTSSHTMLFDSPNDSNRGGWKRSTSPTATPINALSGQGTYCSSAWRGFRFNWTELQRCSDGDEISDDREWQARAPSYGFIPAGYRVWYGPKPAHVSLFPTAPFTLVDSNVNSDYAPDFELPDAELPNTYPNSTFE